MTIEHFLLWPLMLVMGCAAAAILIATVNVEPKRVPAKVRARRRPF